MPQPTCKKIAAAFRLLLLITTGCTAQISSFIVTTSHDTINVDKINLYDFEIKTKTAGKKKRYNTDEVISYYVFEENQHYQRITLEKKEPKPIDRYDYKRNEDLYLEQYKNRIRYKFIPRLTAGKVKLFVEASTLYTGAHTAGGSPAAAPIALRNQTFYISVNDSRLEKLSDDITLKLTREVADLLKIYLYGNEKISRELNRLSALTPAPGQQEIVDLVNEYNAWAAK